MIKLMKGDCLEEILKIFDDSIDLVLCDPPSHCKWDVVIPLDYMWKELNRVGNKDTTFLFTCSQPLTSVLVASNVENFKCEWVWETNGSNLGAVKYKLMKEHESVAVFCRGKSLYHPIRENDLRLPKPIQKFNRERRHQKPIALMQYLIKTYSNKGDTVLDFTMGSGSTGVASVLEERNFIGIEKDEKYFEIAEMRIDEALKNMLC